MAKKSNQKAKLLVLYQLLQKKGDEEHPISTPELIQALDREGIPAERKSVYTDMETLRDFGVDVQLHKGKKGGWFIGQRDFELPELKLLVAAGADASEIVYWDYDSLVLDLSQRLILMSVLLDSDSARREITGSRLWMLVGLRRQLTETVEDISRTGPAAADEALEQLERLRDELDGLTGLEPLD